MRATSTLLAVLLAACGGKATPSSTTTTSSQSTAASTPFELGEITVFQGQDAMLKIHADGTTELGYRHGTMTVSPGQTGSSSNALPVSWKPGPKVTADGKLEAEDRATVQFGVDGTLTEQKEGKTKQLPLKVRDDSVVVSAGGSSYTLSLGADGIVKLPPGAKVPPGTESHVEGATTPGKRRLVLTFLGILFYMGVPVEMHEGASAAAPPG
jgi:hypothetical protein